MHGQGKALLFRPSGDRPEECRAYGVGRVGRNSDPDPGRGQVGKLLDTALEAGQAVLSLGGMRAENLLVCDARAASLGKHPDDGTRIAGVGNCRDAGREAIGQAATGSLEVTVGVSAGLELPQTSDPGGEFWIGHQAFEAGEFQVSVGVDQAGKECSIRKVGGRHAGGPGHDVIGTDRLNSAMSINQHCATLDRCADYGKNPACGYPPLAHLSAGYWEPGQLPP